MKIELPESLIHLIRGAGAPVYVVGGYVRNALSGLGKTDIDLSGPLIASALKLPTDAKVRVVNFRLGTAIVSYRGQNYEYTPFRVERYAVGGAHTPIEIQFTSDMAQDAARRDFAANSIYYDPIADKLIDFFDGIEDCEKKILRTPYPEKVFASDGLRIMRLVRIAAETGFKIEAETAQVAISRRAYLQDISPERIREELDRILLADQKNGLAFAHYRGLKLLARMKLLPYILPQLALCEGVEQNPAYHKFDVLEHTFQAVKFASPEVRLAALMHDVGKPYCMRMFGNMHGHEKISERFAREALGQNGLKYPNNVVEEVAQLCLYHMYDMAGNTGEGKLRLFVARNFNILDKLVSLMNADRLGTGVSRPEQTHRLTQMRERLIAENAPIRVTDLQIDGTELANMGLVGKQIGDTLEQLWQMCILEPKLNNQEWLQAQIQKCAKQ